MERLVDLRRPLRWAGLSLIWLAIVPLTGAFAYLKRNEGLRRWLNNYARDPASRADSFQTALSVPLRIWIPSEVVGPLGWLAFLAIGYWVVCLLRCIRAEGASVRRRIAPLLLFIAFMFAPVGSGGIAIALPFLLKNYALWGAIPLSGGMSLLYIWVFRSLNKDGRMMSVLSLVLGLITILEFITPSLSSGGLKTYLMHAHDMKVGLILGTISSANFMVATLILHAASLTSSRFLKHLKMESGHF